MIITIGGLAGSGTTTAAKILSEKLQIPYLSAGEIFRQMAVEKGMDIMEFGKFAEGNDEIDLEIDRRQAQLAKEYTDLIVEGRLSAHFVEADLKIWFVAPHRYSNRTNMYEGRQNQRNCKKRNYYKRRKRSHPLSRDTRNRYWKYGSL